MTGLLAATEAQTTLKDALLPQSSRQKQVVLRIPDQGLFFLPCYLQAAWRLESTRHSTGFFSVFKIGLALTALSSLLLAPCPCESDGSSDPGMILFLFLPIPMPWRQLCLKHNTTAPREKCLPYHLCPRHSLLKRANILYKWRTERTQLSVRVVMKKDLSNTNNWISTLPGGPVRRFVWSLSPVTGISVDSFLANLAL